MTPRAPEGASPIASDDRARVLVVDDDVLVLRATQRWLKRNGHDAVAVETARDALARLAEHRFDVVISDIAMPDMDGIAFLGELRRTDGDIPVVLVTGAPQSESEAAAARLGATAYLAKPVDGRALLDEVARAARAHRLTRGRRA
jgi:DNA-binding NtrC family response regulator